MRLNKFLAHSSGISRRAADEAIADGRVAVNGSNARVGQKVVESDEVKLDGRQVKSSSYTYLLLNKPVGYLSSRKGQSAPTLYELIPDEFKDLKTVGRLDKDSSGLILLTDDGDYTFEMTHPKFKKVKKYQVTLDRPLEVDALNQLGAGVELDDGPSRLQITSTSHSSYEVEMSQGRNRQIRRTFEHLGYQVKKLHRTQFGHYFINDLKNQTYQVVAKL